MKQLNSRQLSKKAFPFLILAFVSVFAYAEHTAPVYDVDSMSSDSASVNVAVQDDNSKTALNQALTASSEPPATVEQRMERMERQFTNLQQSDLSNRLNSMQGEIQALRGQVEEFTHQLQELRNQQRNQHAEADKAASRDLADQQAISPVPRVGDEEGVSSPKTLPVSKTKAKTEASLEKQTANLAETRVSVTKKTLPPSFEQPNLVEEQSVYQTAYNLIKIKKYNEAIGILQKMLAKYPSGQSAANAHYWLGELYSLTSENERAASEFLVVVKQYPNSPRVADAELKLGLINATLLKWPAAKASFKKVITKYPGTTSARLAMEQLKLLKQSGH